MFKTKYWIPAIFWMGFIFFLSSIPNLVDPLGFDQYGYIKHFSLYGILGLLLAFGHYKAGIDSKKIILLVVIIGFLYGISDEFHQFFVPGRSPDVLDVVSDTAGSFIGSLIYLINKIRKQ